MLIEIYCNDLMFSGHTAVNVVSAMLWSFSRVGVAWKVTWWALVLAACGISVTRDHYSADVLVALIITVLVGLFKARHHCCVWPRQRGGQDKV